MTIVFSRVVSSLTNRYGWFTKRSKQSVNLNMNMKFYNDVVFVLQG